MFPSKSDDSSLNAGQPPIHKLGLIGMGSTQLGQESFLKDTTQKYFGQPPSVYTRACHGHLPTTAPMGSAKNIGPSTLRLTPSFNHGTFPSFVSCCFSFSDSLSAPPPLPSSALPSPLLPSPNVPSLSVYTTKVKARTNIEFLKVTPPEVPRGLRERNEQSNVIPGLVSTIAK